MGKKITQYPNNVSTNPDNLSLLDLSEKTGASTFESRKWNLTAFKAWVNSWVVAGSVAWNNITGKPNVVDTTGGTPNYVAKFTDTDTIEESQIFDNGTNVGIGTITPGTKLQVVGDIMVDYAGVTPLRVNNTLITQTDATGITGIYLGDNGSGVNMIQREKHTANSAGINLYAEYGYNTQSLVAKFQYNLAKIFVGAIQRFHITGNGDVGIGDNITPSAKLHVNNTTTAYSFLVEDDANPDSTPFVIGNKGNVSIGDFPADETVKLYVYSMNAVANHKGVKIYTESGTNTTGLYVESLVSTAGDGIGAEIISTQNTVGVTTYGVKAYGKGAGGLDLARSLVSYGLWAESNGGVQNIGLYAKTYGTSGTNYSCQLIDGTEDVDKILKSVTNDGKANWANFPCEVQLACSDETTALTTGVKTTIRIPNNMRVTEVRASLTTPQTSGSILTIDLLAGGVSSIFGTKLTVDNGETTSKTALTPPTFSASPPTSYYLADDTEIKVSITQIGDGTAKGLKILIKGYRVSW